MQYLGISITILFQGFFLLSYSDLCCQLGLCFDRLLISRLEEVDLRNLNYEEKLAFWINIHNSLVMHVNMSTFCIYYFILTLLSPQNRIIIISLFLNRRIWLMEYLKTMSREPFYS